jgi:hypothetical protein
MRASTGTVTVGPSADIYNSPTNYYAYDGYLSPQAAERAPDHRSSRRMPDRKLEAQPISSMTYRDPGQSTKLRTEYAIRERPRSNTDSARRPLSLAIPASTSRQGPVVTSTYNRSASPLPPRSAYAREDPERYVTPASSIGGRNQRRIYSLDYGSDTGRLDPGDRVGRAHRDRGAYRIYRPGGVSAYPAYGDPRKLDDSDYYDAYSYTTPRDLFEKDSALRSSQRGTYRTGRPVSMAGADAFLGHDSYKDPRSLGPPPSHRGFDKIVDEDRLRRPGPGRAENDLSRDSTDSRRSSWHRAPVALHQDPDEEYLSYTDDLKGSRRHRRHHDEGPSGRHRREHREPRKHTADQFLAPVLGGLATLGLASGYSEEALDPDRPSRREGHRSRGHDRSRDHGSDSETRDYRDAKAKSKGLTAEEEDEYRSHRRQRERSKRRDHNDPHGSSSSGEEARKKRREKSSRKQHDSDSSDGDHKKQSRDDPDKSRRHHKEDAPVDPGKRSPGDSAEDRPRKPVTVEPAPVKEPEAPPKGILKPPREKFPEDGNPIREGVAPLKDAQKKGIPTGARWTKIDRRLVNPAALESAHERFEERPEYVIVLRVLTKEEIQAFAVKTQEIRGEYACEGGSLLVEEQRGLTLSSDARYREAQQERRRLREERRRNGEHDSSSSDDEDEDENAAPLAIEPPPEEDDFPVPRPKQRAANEAVAEPVKVEW